VAKQPGAEGLPVAVIPSIPTRDQQLKAEPLIGADDRALLRVGIELFDAGEFWEAHERWETIWQRESRPIRSFYQGLIQIAAAYHHWTVTHRPKGVELGIAKGIEKLTWYRPEYLGVDLAKMIDEAEHMRASAAGHDAAWLAAFPIAELPHIPQIDATSAAEPPR